MKKLLLIILLTIFTQPRGTLFTMKLISQNEKIDESLEEKCPICRKEFDDLFHIPMTLSCCHQTLCRRCIEKLIIAQAQIKQSWSYTSCDHEYTELNVENFIITNIINQAIETKSTKLDLSFCDLEHYNTKILLTKIKEIENLTTLLLSGYGKSIELDWLGQLTNLTTLTLFLF